MARQLKFRAQDIASNKWLYGDLRHHKNDVCIFEQGGNKGEQVKRDTIGQFTGMTDKNGVEIFEGDIVCKRDLTFNLQYKGVVVYNSAIGCFRIHSESKAGTTRRMGFEVSEVYNDGQCTVPVKYDYEVIGNIYDNPELLNIK